MSSVTPQSLNTLTWHRDNYTCTTSPNPFLRHNVQEAINISFASPALPWAKRMPPADMATMLNHSVCFGIFVPSQPSLPLVDDSQPRLVAFARLITDHVTLAYLTDVYVVPEYQGRGLSKWIVDCVKEWVEERAKGEAWRRLILITDEGKKEKFYEGVLGTKRIEDEGLGIRLFATRPKVGWGKE